MFSKTGKLGRPAKAEKAVQIGINGNWLIPFLEMHIK